MDDISPEEKAERLQCEHCQAIIEKIRLSVKEIEAFQKKKTWQYALLPWKRKKIENYFNERFDEINETMRAELESITTQDEKHYGTTEVSEVSERFLISVIDAEFGDIFKRWQ